MPALTIRRPANRTARRAKRHPKAKLITEGGLRLTFPFAPNDVEHDGLADEFGTLERPGRKPLVTYNAEGLRTTSFAILLAHPDHQRPVEGYINKLRRVADSGERVTISLSALERGVWQLTGLTIRTQLRQEGTNAVTRAIASLTFTEAVGAVVNVGPLSGGKKKKRGKKKPAREGGGKAGGSRKATVQRYTVKGGDTLAAIALRFYDDPNEWPRIAKASGIRDPRRLKVGARLTIPPA